MEHLAGILNELIFHEYILALFGVVLWELEQVFAKKIKTKKKFFGNIGRSMVWIGLIVSFDDELLARYNAIALVHYKHPPFWMYILIGFLTDIIRTRFTKKVKEEDAVVS